jgi:hypothetical protein
MMSLSCGGLHLWIDANTFFRNPHADLFEFETFYFRDATGTGHHHVSLKNQTRTRPDVKKIALLFDGGNLGLGPHVNAALGRGLQHQINHVRIKKVQRPVADFQNGDAAVFRSNSCGKMGKLK